MTPTCPHCGIEGWRHSSFFPDSYCWHCRHREADPADWRSEARLRDKRRQRRDQLIREAVAA